MLFNKGIQKRMTKEEAKKLLKYHGFTHEDVNHPKMEKGFLGMLRPFAGDLIEENYHEVMEAIKALSDDLRDNEKVDREVISAIWGICYYTRAWAIESESALQRNNLIKKDQVEKLKNWIDVISYTTKMILDGCDNPTAFEFYENYFN